MTIERPMFPPRADNVVALLPAQTIRRHQDADDDHPRRRYSKRYRYSKRPLFTKSGLNMREAAFRGYDAIEEASAAGPGRRHGSPQGATEAQKGPGESTKLA